MCKKDKILILIWSAILCILLSPVERQRIGATATWEEMEKGKQMIVASSSVPENDLICLATNVYMEARGEPLQGQIAVAQVTMNRAKQDRNKVCKVVMAKSQFSWTLDGKVEIKEEDSFKIAVWVAKNVLNGNLHDHAQGADHYHADYLNSDNVAWADQKYFVKKIGKHLFYRLKQFKTS